MNGLKYLHDINVKGKTVLLRVDLNSNVVDWKAVMNDRIVKHAKVMNDLAGKGAKVVVLSHQGRHGKKDYISMKQHSELIPEVIGRKIKFHPIDENVDKAIKKMEEGDIMLLENTRFLFGEKVSLSPEEHAKRDWVRLIAKNCDLFVQDALSICHRPHASVVGFAPLLPCFVGPTLERELKEVQDQLTAKQSPKIFILSGAKLNEPIDLMKRMLEEERTDFVLCGGMMGKMLLKAKGVEFGGEEAFMEKKGYNEFLPLLKQLMEKYGDKIILPVDLALDVDGQRQEINVEELPSRHSSFDIGSKTVEIFSGYIKKAKCMTLNGPLGMFEKEEFASGTRQVFQAVAQAEGHSILGGGQTLEAMKKFGFEEDSFSLVSLAGGALLDYLAGKKLPGIECLRQKTFNSNGFNGAGKANEAAVAAQ